MTSLVLAQQTSCRKNGNLNRNIMQASKELKTYFFIQEENYFKLNHMIIN